MRLFLIALAVAYALMVVFAQTLNIGSREVLSSASPSPGYSASAQSLTSHGVNGHGAGTDGVSAHSVAVTSGQPTCGAAEAGAHLAAGGCIEPEPQRR